MLLDMEIVLDALAWVESRWQEHLVSSAGAIGYYQIKPSTAKWLGYSPSMLWNKDEARVVARAYLQYLLKHFDGDMVKAISAYNHGPANVSKGRFNKRYYYRVLGAAFCILHNLNLPAYNAQLEQYGFLFELLFSQAQHKASSLAMRKPVLREYIFIRRWYYACV